MVTESNRLKQRSIDLVKRQLGLPEHTEFLGYIIKNKQDEFIQDVVNTILSSQRKFTQTLELAKRFENIADAYKLASSANNEMVVGLFKQGQEFVVYPINL